MQVDKNSANKCCICLLESSSAMQNTKRATITQYCILLLHHHQETQSYSQKLHLLPLLAWLDVPAFISNRLDSRHLLFPHKGSHLGLPSLVWHKWTIPIQIPLSLKHFFYLKVLLLFKMTIFQHAKINQLNTIWLCYNLLVLIKILKTSN